MQYYLPYVESGNDSSGAYDFKLGKDMSKHVFSKFQKMETYRTKQLGIQCFTGYYRDDDTKEMYTFMLRVLPDVPDALEWEIQLHGIPISDGFGKEVVGTWDFDGL